MIPRKPVSPEAMLLKMMDLCARSEQSSGEIRQKLYRKGITGHEDKKIIDRLIDDSFIDDSRFARAFTNDKTRFALWGRRKIRAGLAAKGITGKEAADALAQIDEDEYAEAALKAARAKARNLDLNDYSERMKLFRHLASRGYEPEAISSAISRLSE